MGDKEALARVVHDIHHARLHNNVDGMMKFMDPDCSFRIVGSGRLGPMTQRADGGTPIREILDLLVNAWDFSQIETRSLHVDGDTAFAHRAGKVRQNPDGQWYETEFMDKFRFKNGRVIDFVEFVDTLLIAEIIGIVKEPIAAAHF